MPRQHHPKFAQNQGRARPCTHPHAPGSHGEEPRPTARTPCRSPTHSHAASARSPSLPATSHPEQHPRRQPMEQVIVRCAPRTGRLYPIAGRFPAVCRALYRCGRPALARQPDSKSKPEPHRQCAGTTGAFRKSKVFIGIRGSACGYTSRRSLLHDGAAFLFLRSEKCFPDASWHPLPIDPAKAVAYRNTPEPVSYAAMINRTV